MVNVVCKMQCEWCELQYGETQQHHHHCIDINTSSTVRFGSVCILTFVLYCVHPCVCQCEMYINKFASAVTVITRFILCQVVDKAEATSSSQQHLHSIRTNLM